MSSLIVGGLAIPVAYSSPREGRIEAVDRVRRFDGGYMASQTGGATKEWMFSTPPVTRALADTYKAALSNIAPVLCSGDIISIPTMCIPELHDSAFLKAVNAQYVTVDFILHEVQPAIALLRYSPGDTLSGETFARSTTATYLDNIGAVRYAAINVKRDGHYAGGVPSLLLEDARTNLIIRAEAFDNAAWAKSTAGGGSLPVVTADNGVAPDGFLSAEKVVFAAPTSGDTSLLTQTPTVVNATVYTGTLWVKAFGAGDIGKVLLFRQVGAAAYTTLTLTSIWQRLGSTETSTSTTGNFEVGLRPAVGGSSGTVSAFLWGAQLEQGSFSTSYIPTTTAAVTRGADVYSSPAPPPQEMTFYAKFVEGGTINIAGARVLQISSAGNGSPQFIVSAPSAYSTFHANATTSVSSTLGVSPVRGDTVELNARLFGDGSVDITQSINGGAATSATQSAANALAAAWSALTLWFNQDGAGSVRGFTSLQSLKVIAGARSLAEMRSL